jgi:hypothetical protein
LGNPFAKRIERPKCPKIGCYAVNGPDVFGHIRISHQDLRASDGDPQASKVFKNDSSIWIASPPYGALALGGFLLRIDCRHSCHAPMETGTQRR